MPEKQKTSHNWKNPKTIIAAISVTGLLTLWNTFATHDRQRTDGFDSVVPTSSAVPEAESDNRCSVPSLVKNLGTKCITVAQTRSS